MKYKKYKGIWCWEGGGIYKIKVMENLLGTEKRK